MRANELCEFSYIRCYHWTGKSGVQIYSIEWFILKPYSDVFMRAKYYLNAFTIHYDHLLHNIQQVQFLFHSFRAFVVYLNVENFIKMDTFYSFYFIFIRIVLFSYNTFEQSAIWKRTPQLAACNFTVWKALPQILLIIFLAYPHFSSFHFFHLTFVCLYTYTGDVRWYTLLLYKNCTLAYSLFHSVNHCDRYISNIVNDLYFYLSNENGCFCVWRLSF